MFKIFEQFPYSVEYVFQICHELIEALPKGQFCLQIDEQTIKILPEFDGIVGCFVQMHQPPIGDPEIAFFVYGPDIPIGNPSTFDETVELLSQYAEQPLLVLEDMEDHQLQEAVYN